MVQHMASSSNSEHPYGVEQIYEDEYEQERNVELFFTLEELYTGLTKKFQYTGYVPGGGSRKVSTILEVVVRPGYKDGTRIRFRRVGAMKGNLVFTIREKEHDRFRRVGHDLEIVHRLSLADALAGCAITVTGIDGQDHHIDCFEDIIKPSSKKVIGRAGMPMSKRPGESGNLVVRFHVVFPSILRPSTRVKLRQLLFDG